MPSRVLAVAGLSAALVGPVSAQAPEPEATPAPSDAEVATLRWSTAVVVTAERAPEARLKVPAATAVMDREEIARLPAARLSELLDYLPGFTVLSDEGTAGLPVVTARGFFGGGESGYVQLRVDGVPVADVESSLADWSGVSASSVERLEALRGPASALYGDTALGGVVEVFTGTGTGTGRDRAHLAVSGGSLGEGGLDAGLSRRVGGLDVTLRGAGRLGPGARDHSDRDELNAGLTLGLGEADRRWSLDVALADRDRQDPGPLSREELDEDRRQSNPAFRFDGEDRRKWRGALRYSGSWSRTRLGAAVWASTRQSDLVRTLWLAPGLSDSAARDLTADARGAVLDVERRWSALGRPGELRAGAELAREDLESGYFAVEAGGQRGAPTAGASVQRDRSAVFASLGWDVTERLRLTTGLRFDRVADDPRDGPASASHEAWSPRAGLTLRLGGEAAPVGVHLQLSRSFKVATLDQLYDPRPFPDFQGGSLQISNPELDPQRARSFELGVSRDGSGLRVQAVAYRIDVDDEIDFDLATFAYANIVESRHTGLEVEARLWPQSPVSPALVYAWSRAESTSGADRGSQLKNVPEHVFEPSLAARLPLGIRAELRLRLLAGRYLDDANAFPIPDSTLLDLRVSGSAGPLGWSVDALNLTDDERADYGFTLADFQGGAVPYFYPGARRTLRARLVASF